MSASNNSRNLYRDPQKGKIAGVCAGLADYFGVETWIVRLLAITGLIFAGFITFTAYIAAWFLLDKKPVTLYGEQEADFAEVRMKARSWQAGVTPHHRPGARHARAQTAAHREAGDLQGVHPAARVQQALSTVRARGPGPGPYPHGSVVTGEKDPP